jgi:predicted DNA-binding transcriptional regulator AlpA
MSPFCDVDQVAELLHRSPKAVRHLRARRLLPEPIKVGRRLLWDREALLRWVQEGRAGHGSKP